MHARRSERIDDAPSDFGDVIRLDDLLREPIAFDLGDPVFSVSTVHRERPAASSNDDRKYDLARRRREWDSN